MTKRNPRTSVKTLVAGALVVALAAGAACASANALDDSVEPLVGVATVQTDGLSGGEAVAAARTFLGIPEACVGDTLANLVQHAGRTCWKVKVTEAGGEGVDWHVLLDPQSEAVLDWWHE